MPLSMADIMSLTPVPHWADEHVRPRADVLNGGSEECIDDVETIDAIHALVREYVAQKQARLAAEPDPNALDVPPSGDHGIT